MQADSSHLQVVAFINFVTDAVEPQNLVEIKIGEGRGGEKRDTVGKLGNVQHIGGIECIE